MQTVSGFLLAFIPQLLISLLQANFCSALRVNTVLRALQCRETVQGALSTPLSWLRVLWIATNVWLDFTVRMKEWMRILLNVLLGHTVRMEQISLNSVLKEPILRQLNSRAQLSAHFVILENIVMKEE